MICVCPVLWALRIFLGVKRTRSNKLLGDFSDLPLPDNYADYVVCVAALHHVEERLKFFKEAQRVLKPTGRFVIADVLDGSQTGFFLNGFVNEFNSMGHEGKFLNTSINQLLSAVGFGVISEHNVNMQWHFEHKKQMVDFCRGLFGLDLASDDDIEQGVRDLLNAQFNDKVNTLDWSLTYIIAEPE